MTASQILKDNSICGASVETWRCHVPTRARLRVGVAYVAPTALDRLPERPAAPQKPEETLTGISLLPDNCRVENTHPKLAVRIAVRAVLLFVFIDGILFGVSGRLSWGGAWLLTTLLLSSLAVMLPWAVKKAPELLDERMNPGANVKPWDKVILAIYQSLILAVLAVAALDAGRFRSSTMSPLIQIAGAVAFLFLVGWIWWTMSANAFLSSRARIQSDRQQQVATGGPYRYVRHPMYVAIILLVPSMALVLGSWWAMIPAALVGPLFMVRTALEDRMLLEELAGYRDYASRVRYRLAPGIW